jgi:uncharacterized iron-regulated membrane protein
MSYPWASDLVYRIAGSPPPPRPTEERSGARSRAAAGGPMSAADAEALDRFWPIVERQSPGWKAITLRVPERRDTPVPFTIEEGRFANRFARSSLLLDRETGEVRNWEPYAAAGAGRRARSWMRFLHTGESLGLPGQTVAATASLGGTVLAVTGIALALRRFLAWRARRAPEKAASSKSSPADEQAGLSTKGAVS